MLIYEVLGKSRQEFDQQMKSAGHKRLGYGIEAIVYSDPNNPNRVIKVLLGKEKPPEGSERRAFEIFYNYCKANKDNPHVPRFFKSEKIDHNGQKILKVEMEKLKKLSPFQESIIADMASAANHHESYDKLIRSVKNKLLDRTKNKAHPNLINQTKNELLELESNRDQYEPLYNTIFDFTKLARQHQLMPDIWNTGSHNVMQRADGTIVVIDPFTD